MYSVPKDDTIYINIIGLHATSFSVVSKTKEKKAVNNQFKQVTNIIIPVATIG
jgi:hypothetical protein